MARSLLNAAGVTALMALSNSTTRGHPKFPQAGRLDYGDTGVMAMCAAASLRRQPLPSNSSIAQRCMRRSRMVLAMVTSPRYSRLSKLLQQKSWP